MIRKFIVRILKFLSRIKAIGKVISFTYKGEGLSLNKFYSQGHWRTRANAKTEYKLIFENIISKAKGKYFFDRFYMVIFYNSRHDVDNVIGMEKVFVDTMKGVMIKNDGKVNYKGIMIFYDDSLPNNTFEFVIIEATHG